MLSYMIVQERYEEGFDGATQDFYPIMFATPEECFARIKRDGFAAMFEHAGDSYYLSEHTEFKGGIIPTLKTVEIPADVLREGEIPKGGIVVQDEYDSLPLFDESGCGSGAGIITMKQC